MFTIQPSVIISLYNCRYFCKFRIIISSLYFYKFINIEGLNMKNLLYFFENQRDMSPQYVCNMFKYLYLRNRPNFYKYEISCEGKEHFAFKTDAFYFACVLA